MIALLRFVDRWGVRGYVTEREYQSDRPLIPLRCRDARPWYHTVRGRSAANRGQGVMIHRSNIVKIVGRVEVEA